MYWLLHITASTASDNGGTNLPAVDAGPTQLNQILQIVIGTTAAIAVLFLIIGGLRFVLSAGDPQGVSRARSTILYAVVGLLVAIVAEAIVSLVLGHLG